MDLILFLSTSKVTTLTIVGDKAIGTIALNSTQISYETTISGSVPTTGGDGADAQSVIFLGVDG